MNRSRYLLILGILILAIVWYTGAGFRHKNLLKQIPPPAATESMDLLDSLYDQTQGRKSSVQDIGRLGMAYHANYDYARAETCYKLALLDASSAWQWHYYRGLIEEELGDSQAAVESLTRAVEINPRLTQAWYRLGNQYLKLNKYSEARHAYEQARLHPVYTLEEARFSMFVNRGAFPLESYASLGLARVAEKMGQSNEALQTLSVLTREQPTFGPGYRLMGQIYDGLGDHSQGKIFTEKAGDYESFTPPADPLFDELVWFSRSSDLILKQVILANKHQKYEWAKHLSHFMLDQDIETGEALVNLIHIAVETYQFSEVPELVEAHYSSYIKNYDKLLEMGLYLARKEQFRFALRYLGKASWLKPEAVRPRLEFAKILVLIGDLEKAREALTEILALSPNEAEAHIQLGKIFYLENDTRQASKHFRLALTSDTQRAVALIHLAIIARVTHEPKAALMYFSQSIEAEPRNSSTWVERGNYLLELGEWQAAEKNFRDALDFAPNDIDFLERMAWILATVPDEHIRDGKEALRIARRLASMLKIRTDQNISCGIALAVAFAEDQQFDKALGVVQDLQSYAQKTRVMSFDSQLKTLQQHFQQGQAFRLEPASAVISK